MIFNTSERKGVLVLVFLITGLIVLPRQFLSRDCDLFLLPEMVSIQGDSLIPIQDSGQKRADAPAFKYKKTKSIPIELNTADSGTLVKIKGIGPYYASKILHYRKRLGGFYAITQLKEIKMTYFNLDSSAHFFIVNPNLICKTDLDTMSFKSILHHPYLEYEDVQMIFNAKRKFGSVSYSILEEKGILPAYKLKKIKPYFK